MPKEKLYIKDVGVYRVSRYGIVDDGSDGVLWLPEKRLAVVADGISKQGGDGEEDIERFEFELVKFENTRRGIREAFYSTVGFLCESTIVSLWFPEEEILLHYPEFESVEKSKDLEYLRRKKDILERIHFIRDRMKNYSFSSSSNEDDGRNHFFLRCSLMSLIRESKSAITFTMHDPEHVARKKIGNGIPVHVKDSDRFALVSDGIYSDVLSLEECLEVLSGASSARDAARDLVQEAQNKKPYWDDRGAVVVDLSTKAPRQGVRPVRESIGRTKESRRVKMKYIR